jgi:hypothetical protein
MAQCTYGGHPADFLQRMSLNVCGSPWRPPSVSCLEVTVGTNFHRGENLHEHLHQSCP